MPILEMIGSPGSGKTRALTKLLSHSRGAKETITKRYLVENNYNLIAEKLITYRPRGIIEAVLLNLAQKSRKLKIQESFNFYKETLAYHQMFVGLNGHLVLEEGFFQIFCSEILSLSRIIPAKVLFKDEIASGYSLILVERPIKSIVNSLVERQSTPEFFKQGIDDFIQQKLLTKYVEDQIIQRVKLVDLYKRAGGNVFPSIVDGVLPKELDIFVD